MDGHVLAWARRVKARGDRAAITSASSGRFPALWLFTDAERGADPEAIVRRLPRGLCGVVFRHDRHPGRAALAIALARLCRERGFALSVAGDWRLALRVRAGIHLRGGSGDRRGLRAAPFVTCSVHRSVDAIRVRRLGHRALAFISPVFRTASHVDRDGIGVRGWRTLARGLGPAGTPAALGGLTPEMLKRLPRQCLAIGGIGLFQP